MALFGRTDVPSLPCSDATPERAYPFVFAFFRSAAVALAAAFSLVSTNAKADTNACVSAHSSGQFQAKAGRLKLASELFTACGVSSDCPEQVREDCERLLENTRTAIPTVILSVLDEQGGDVAGARVFSGDDLIADGLDGRAVELDPGEHHLRFLLPGGQEISKHFLIREGEKNRLIQMHVEPQTPRGGPTPGPTPLEPDPQPPASTPVAAWTATGFAVAGAAVFGTFAYLGSRKKADLDACAPSCPRSLEPVRDDLATSYLIADIGLGAAVVSSVVAVYLFATHGPDERSKPAATPSPLRLNTGLSAGANGAGLVLSGGF